MNDDRNARVWASINAVAQEEGARVSVRHACVACSRSITAAGAGLSMTRDGRLHEPVYATDPLSQELEELQFTLGEGPCMDANAGDRPVLVPDVASAWAERRWPMFAPAIAERGIVAVFAIPLAAGAARLGVMDLYRTRGGLLTREELAEVLTFADAILMLALEHGDGDTGLDDLFAGDFAERRAEVHQAAGMVAAQIGASIVDALARLRAYAYAQDQRLGDVVAAVLARRLRFRPNGRSDGGPPDDGRTTGPRDGPAGEKGGEIE
ncbi:GAF and ANTAR domain-containing protein [Actinoallomurus sp. NPDC050550]|uniref:GAF and ANTAR domain-containing protein n=1 Tax=Actinoallomurus sp. NPDC050550 TaxID=3154937 RepID=UPI0033C7EBEF